MGQKKDLSQISTGFEEWLSCFPLQGKKLFSLVYLKLPKDREVPISDKCYCNTDAQRTWTFKLWWSDLDCWPLLGLSGVSKEYWVLQIGPKGVNLLNPLNLWLVVFFSCHFKETKYGGRGQMSRHLYSVKMSRVWAGFSHMCNCRIYKLSLQETYSWNTRLCHD